VIPRTHTGQLDGAFRRRERRLSNVERASYHAVYVGTGHRQHHPCSKSLDTFALDADEDAVRDEPRTTAQRVWFSQSFTAAAQRRCQPTSAFTMLSANAREFGQILGQELRQISARDGER
jgi:hypothetical protein